MKRFIILLIMLLFFAGSAVFADESVLIDFATLVADYQAGGDGPMENKATMIDFSDKAGTSFADEDKKKMKTSLAIENWQVRFVSSSRTVINQANSLIKEAPVKEASKRYGGQRVLGMRIHFPTGPFNSLADILPPFEIPGYMRKDEVQSDGSLKEDSTDLEGSKFNGYGIVKNVGVLKRVSINVYGSNFPHRLSVLLKDQTNTEIEIPVATDLFFDGWRTLVWENPNYVVNVRNRELKAYPLYPNSTPMMKLIGIRVYRGASQPGSDFICYVKDIKLTYDIAVLDVERDFDEEALWGILQKREEKRRRREFKKLGNIQVLRYLEKMKMHQEGESGTDTTSSNSSTTNTTTTAP